MFKYHELTELVCIPYYCCKEGIVLLEGIVISKKIFLHVTQNVNYQRSFLKSLGTRGPETLEFIIFYKINTAISRILTESGFIVSYCIFNKTEKCCSLLYTQSKFGIWLLPQQYILLLSRLICLCVLLFLSPSLVTVPTKDILQ